MSSQGELQPISFAVARCMANAESALESVPQKAAHSQGMAAASDTPPWRNSLAILAEPIPEIRYLLADALPSEAVVLLSGREGTLKTWLALDWASAIAEGWSWLGRATQSASVLFLNAEMPTNLFRTRLQAIKGSSNLQIWEWQSERFPHYLDDCWLKEAARSHKLIILDTLKRFMPGLDENSSTDMAKVTEALRKLTRYGATVLALHHAPKDPTKLGYRGSTELGAGVDMTLTLERVERNGMDLLQLTAPKTRYPEDPRMTLRVIRTPERPIFENAIGEAGIQAINELEAKLEALGGIIKALMEQNGEAPNQTDIIRLAQSQNVASRNTILDLLAQGEGKRWRSKAQGKSRVYDLSSNPAP